MNKNSRLSKRRIMIYTGLIAIMCAVAFYAHQFKVNSVTVGHIQNIENEVINARTDEHIHIYVDGENLNQNLLVYGNTNDYLVPLRAVAEALGFEVIWHNEDPRGVKLKRGNYHTEIEIGKYSYVYGQQYPLSIGVNPELKLDLTYVPLSFVESVLKAKISENENRDIIISSK